MFRYCLVVVCCGFIAFFGVSGCQSILKPDRVVISKSSETRPKWLEDVIRAEPRNKIYIVGTKKGLFRLDLGVKQTQAWVVQNRDTLLFDRVVLGLKQAVSQSVSSGKAPKVLLDEKIIDRISSDLRSQIKASREPLVENIYWEQIRVESSDVPVTSYEISVLGILPRADYDVSVAAALALLRKSGTPQALALADAMGQSENPEQEPASEVEAAPAHSQPEEPIEGVK